MLKSRVARGPLLCEGYNATKAAVLSVFNMKQHEDTRIHLTSVAATKAVQKVEPVSTSVTKTQRVTNYAV